jgi:hypothetical protein
MPPNNAAWQLIAQTHNAVEAAMMEGVLTENGIAAQVLNLQDSSYPLLGGPVQVFVPAHLVALARTVLASALRN